MRSAARRGEQMGASRRGAAGRRAQTRTPRTPLAATDYAKVGLRWALEGLSSRLPSQRQSFQLLSKQRSSKLLSKQLLSKARVKAAEL